MDKKEGNSRAEGYCWEQKAAEFLEQKGCEIVTRNFYSPFGEVDIIARDGRYLVFVEVKYRRNSRTGSPLEAVDYRKQRRICKTAAYYCLRHGYGEEVPVRFDVIGITEEGILHVEDAFYFLS